jgi:hypothetical protein
MTPVKSSNATMTILTYTPGILIGGYFSMHCWLALQLNNYARVLQKEQCDIFDKHGKVCSARVKEMRATQSPGEVPYEDSGKVHTACQKTMAQRRILEDIEPFIGWSVNPIFWRRQITEIEESAKKDANWSKY